MSISTIKSRIKSHSRKVFYLSNKDFEAGFLRIILPGVYKLTENIILHFPQETIEEYIFHSFKQHDFNFGIHAGIMIETDYVVIDLNGFSISQSIPFYSGQRFFNLIQLNNFPFIPKQKKSGATQGPIVHTSLTHFNEPSYIVIRNGTLGLSSHNAIHGNNNSHVVLEKLKIHSFDLN